MTIASTLVLLQMALSLLTQVQQNPAATIDQENQAINFAVNAIQLTSQAIEQLNTPAIR